MKRISTRTAFDSESLLGQAFIRMLRASALPGTAGFLEEFECGNGIADFVLYTLKPQLRSNLEIGKLNPRYVYPLRLLPIGKAFSVDGFSRKILSSRDRTERLLREFQQLGYCRPGIRKGLWKKVRNPQPITTHICGVEAKLTDWRRALLQAVRYRDYSHQAWVLLDQRAIRPAIANADAFLTKNIGLASISDTGEFEVHFTPSVEKPKSEARFWQANALISAAIIRSFGSIGR